MADLNLVLKIALISALLVLRTGAAPAELQIDAAKNCSDSKSPGESDNFDVIDQRQNGTENILVNIQDVLMAWVPANPLLLAPVLLDAQMLAQDYFASEIQKPSNEEQPTESAPSSSSTELLEDAEKTTPSVTPAGKQIHLKRSKLSLAQLIGSFLRRKH